METVKQSIIIEKTGIFSEDLKKRYEYTMESKGEKGKSILVICMNPTSSNLFLVDTTTNYLMNNLFTMGYSTITLCNLFAEIVEKLKPNEVKENSDNMNFLAEVLKRDFDEILLGYGSGYAGSIKVREEKGKLCKLLKPYEKKLVELLDRDEQYKDLETIHPLFAGQRFSGKWKFRKFELSKNKKDL